jgi:hypothetical protein
VTALAFAACGGDGEESTPATQETPTPAATSVVTGTATATGTPSARQTQTPAATAEPSAGAIDPCSLLTKEEVEAAIGHPVAEPEGEGIGGFLGCDYPDPDVSLLTLLSVSLDIAPDEGAARILYGTYKGLGDGKTLAGIGDDAFWNSGLTVLKGKYILGVDLESPFDTHEFQGDELATLKELAAKALSRLP